MNTPILCIYTTLSGKAVSALPFPTADLAHQAGLQWRREYKQGDYVVVDLSFLILKR
jgi:hypothetical protein